MAVCPPDSVERCHLLLACSAIQRVTCVRRQTRELRPSVCDSRLRRSVRRRLDSASDPLTVYWCRAPWLQHGDGCHSGELTAPPLGREAARRSTKHDSVTSVCHSAPSRLQITVYKHGSGDRRAAQSRRPLWFRALNACATKSPASVHKVSKQQPCV